MCYLLLFESKNMLKTAKKFGCFKKKLYLCKLKFEKISV